MVNPEEFVDREKLSSALAHDVATAAVEAFQSILARTGYRLVSIEIEACEAPQYLRPKKPTEFELDERVACKDAKGAAGRPPKQPPRRPPKQDEGDPGQQAGRPAKEKPKPGTCNCGKAAWNSEGQCRSCAHRLKPGKPDGRSKRAFDPQGDVCTQCGQANAWSDGCCRRCAMLQVRARMARQEAKEFKEGPAKAAKAAKAQPCLIKGCPEPSVLRSLCRPHLLSAIRDDCTADYPLLPGEREISDEDLNELERQEPRIADTDEDREMAKEALDDE